MSLFRALASRPRLTNWLFLAGILSATWLAYWPSLEHMPRADQWAYLLDTRDCRTFGDLLSESYSYNRVRVVGPGDTDLFRPVLFFLLAVEKYCFGVNFVPSQALGLFLHSAIVVLLFSLLRRINQLRPCTSAPWEVVPYAMTMFFALNFASMELVVWAHLHGYLVFLVFVLSALLGLAGYAARTDLSPVRARGTLAGCWLLALLAAFTYELGQFFAVLLGSAFAWIICQTGRRRAASLIFSCFAVILPIYQGLNYWDRRAHAGRFAEEHLQEKILDKAVSLDTLEHAGRFFAFTAVQPFFPSVTGWWYQGERIHVQEPVLGWVKYVQWNPKLAASYGIALLFFGLCVAGGRRWRREDLRRLGPLLAAPAGLFAIYAGVTVLGRMNMRPSNFVLCSNSYYTYIALLFLLVAALVIWQPLARATADSAGGLTRGWRRLNYPSAWLALGLGFLGAYSAGRIHHACERIESTYAPFHAAVRQLDAFIAEHRREPGFRLAFDLTAADPFPVTHSVPFPLVLFPQWIDNHEPSHVVSFPDGQVTIEPVASYRQQHPGKGQLFPDLVRIGSDFNIYFWRGQYYGTLHWDDVFRPDLKDHAYVIVGGTVQEVLAQVPARYDEFMEDLGAGWCIPPHLGTETVEGDYRGFELVHAGAYYYAVPAAEGPFQVNRFNARRYSKAFVTDEIDDLRQEVDSEAGHAAASDPASAKR